LLSAYPAQQEMMMRKFTTALLGVAMLATALPASANPVQTRSLPQVEKAYPNESYAQYYRRGYRPYYRERYYYRRDNGAAVAAGVAGLAAGALIAGAIASQAQPAAPQPPGIVDPQVAAYCARKYRSYDPGTGTFLASNGMRYVCTYP
jgi:anti-sigma factor RsiW